MIRRFDDRFKDLECVQESDLVRILRHSSKTFAHTLPLLRPGLREQNIVSYLIIRVNDEIEDNKNIIEGEKRNYMERFLNCFRYGSFKDVQNLKKEFENLETTKEEFRILFDSLDIVHSYYSGFPEAVRGTIFRYCNEMIQGLSSPNIRKINTIEDHHEYCHSSTGLAGYMVAELMKHADVLDDEGLRKMMPEPVARKLGVNPAHDYMVAFQLINDIRDLREDVKEGNLKWPKKLLDSRGLTYNDLVNLDVTDQSKKEKAEGILEVMTEDARDYIIAGSRFLDIIPYEHTDVRDCWGRSFAMAASTLRVVSKPCFFYNEKCQNISKRELIYIDRKTETLAEEKKDMAPMIRYLLDNHAEHYGSDENEKIQ